MICPLYTEPFYFFYSPDLPVLIYYSYVPAIIVAFIVGAIVLWNDHKSLLNRLLAGICTSFLVWTLGTLTDWTNIHSGTLLFAWSFLGPAAGFISIFAIYFTYVFLEKKDVGLKIKIAFLVLLAPLITLAPSYYTLGGFDLSSCDAFGFEGLTNTLYFPLLGGIAMVWIAILLVRYYRRAAGDVRKQIVLMGTGIEFFLFSFFVTEFLGQYLATAGFLPDSQIETYGYFGMIVFVVYISILTIRFHSFHVHLISAQALVGALLVLIASQFAFVRDATSLTLNGIALLLTAFIGITLVRSVRREITQREHIEKLAGDLEKANDRLKQLDQLKSEFLSVAAHQLRAPLTAVRGYASLILEGDFGAPPPAFNEPLARIMDSVRNMANSIEDYLNVSRIEQGRMKFEKSQFDLADLAKKVVEELTPVAARKHLKLVLEPSPALAVSADIGKIKQVITNLADNAIKYTPTGSVSVKVEKAGANARVTVSDTGIGIDASEIAQLFEKFTRARDANKVNTTGTGLGLYVAKRLVEGHKGRVWVESDGTGKGSRFIFEIPA